MKYRYLKACFLTKAFFTVSSSAQIVDTSPIWQRCDTSQGVRIRIEAELDTVKNNLSNFLLLLILIVSMEYLYSSRNVQSWHPTRSDNA